MHPHDVGSPAPPPARSAYPALVGDLWSLAGGGPVAEAAGLVAVSEGLAEVLRWAAAGQDADETASVWLEQLRWAAALGVETESGAPTPPPSWWEGDVAEALAASGAAPRLELPGLCRALALAQLQYPGRNELGDLDDAAFMDRLVPLAVHPRDSPAHLGQLAVNLTCLTHGHPEALATGMVWALLLRACAVRAEEPRDAAGAASDPREAASTPRETPGAAPEAPHAPLEVPSPARALARGLDDVRELLTGNTPAPAGPLRGGAAAPAGGLLARMAAGGGSVPALARVLEAAPRTRAALLGTDRPEETERRDAPHELARVIRAAHRIADGDPLAAPEDAAARRAAVLSRCCGAATPSPAPGPLRDVTAEAARRWIDAARARGDAQGR